MNRNQFLKILIATWATSQYKLSAQPTLNKKEVIIIGAGISGLAAGRKLVSQGFQVTILEARNRVGGRIWTDSAMGLPVEMGASIIQGVKGNPIISLAKQFKLHTTVCNLEDSEIYDVKGNKLSEEEILKVEGYYKDFVAKLYSMKESASKEESLEAAKQIIISDLGLSESEKANLDWMIKSEIETKEGTSLKNLSLKYFDETESLAGADGIVTNGFMEIPIYLARGLNIKTSHIVSKIEYDNKVKISTSQGEFTSDFAVITVPLGVLKKKKIQFIPELPSKKLSAIQSLGFGVVDKVFLKFSKKFWTNGVRKFGIIPQISEDKVEFWDLNPIKNTPILSRYISGEKAILIESKNKKEIIKECIESLRIMHGNKIPVPLEENHSRWNSDPFSCGTGSYLGVNSEIEDYTSMAEPVNDLLFFAGEATNSLYPSSVHGAYLSGEREADRIIQIAGAN